MGEAEVILGRRRSAALPQFGRADLRVRPNIHSESHPVLLIPYFLRGADLSFCSSAHSSSLRESSFLSADAVSGIDDPCGDLLWFHRGMKRNRARRRAENAEVPRGLKWTQNFKEHALTATGSKIRPKAL